MKLSDIEKIASDPAAIKLFYESTNAFAIFKDGSFGIITDGNKDVVAMAVCPHLGLKKALTTSFMDQMIVIT